MWLHRVVTTENNQRMERAENVFVKKLLVSKHNVKLER